MSTATQKHPPLVLWTNEVVDVPEELDTFDPSSDKCSMQVVTKLDGDYEINYDSKDPIQVSAAKIMFDRMVASGMTAFKVKKPKKGEEAAKSEPGAKVKAFDAKVDHYLFVPMDAQVGG